MERKAIYAQITGPPPYYVVAIDIKEEHYKNLVLCLEEVKNRSISFNSLKTIPYKYLLKVSSVVNLINMSTDQTDRAVLSYKNLITSADIYRRGLDLSLLESFRSLRRLLHYPQSLQVRTSVYTKQELDPCFVSVNSKSIDYAMLIAYSQARILYEERNL